MRIGVLAVQGAFIEHINMLKSLGVDAFEIRCSKDLEDKLDGIVLPGGESTVMGKLIVELDMKEKILSFIKAGMPVLGTCAGMILLAKHIKDDSQVHLGTMDITVLRNAYGRQLGSFNTVHGFDGRDIEMTFIRAPYVDSVDSDAVKVLSTYDNRIVAVQQDNQLALAFHPELTKDTYIHQYFIDMCQAKNKQ